MCWVFNCWCLYSTDGVSVAIQNASQTAWKYLVLHIFNVSSLYVVKMYLCDTRMSAIAIGIHLVQTDVGENPFLLVLSEKMEWRLYQLAEEWTHSFGDGERGKLSQKCFGDFFERSRRRTIHKSFSFPSTWLEFWLLSLATKCCVLKWGQQSEIIQAFYLGLIPTCCPFLAWLHLHLRHWLWNSMHLCRHSRWRKLLLCST